MMQYSILKHDEWNDVLWVYNSISAPIRTLKGALLVISEEDDSIKQTHYFDDHIDTYYSNNCNYPYCGCYVNEVNGLGIYEGCILVSKSSGVVVLTNDSDGRKLNLLSYDAETQINNDGYHHISCSLLSCSSRNPRLTLSSNNDMLYFVDANTGMIDGSIRANNRLIPDTFDIDNITTISDFIGNRTSSHCPLSYHYSMNNAKDYEVNRSYSSLKSIAEKFGSADAIPEFIPGALKHNYSRKVLKHEKTIGAMSLGYILKEQKQSKLINHEFQDLTCLGMASGIVHIVDNRINKIVYTIHSGNKSIHSISASGNKVTTTGCVLYCNRFVYEPIVHIHDLRTQRSQELWLGIGVSKVSIVPKSDRMFALTPDGYMFDCKLSTLEYDKINLYRNHNWQYEDFEVIVPGQGDVCKLYTVDSVCSINRNTLDNIVDGTINTSEIPEEYKKVDLTKRELLNRSPFASLSGTFKGDLAHVFLQIFFFIPALQSLKYHVCEIDYCITCQIGFGLTSLKIAYDNNRNRIDNRFTKNYKSNNVLQVTSLQELIFVDSDTTEHTVVKLLHWLIETMNTELENYGNIHKDINVNFDLIKHVFGYSKRVEEMCQNGHVNIRICKNEFFVKYKLLEDSIIDEIAYCKDCHSMLNVKSKVTNISNPNILIVDCVSDNHNDISCVKEKINFNGDTYTISTILFHIRSTDDFRLLSYVKLPDNYEHLNYNWILINDGIISNVENDADALAFHEKWKCVLVLIYIKDGFKAKDLTPIVDDSVIVNVKGRLVPLPFPNESMPVSPTIFISESNLAHNPKAHDKDRKFIPLSAEELFEAHNSNFLIALDVECVKSDISGNKGRFSEGLKQRNTENYKHSFLYTRQDKNETLLTLARVTAIRASGQLYGVPFLDHYVVKRKPPKDYVTRYSGIHSGDLDLKSSEHWLSTHKSIYLKLRYLVDLGCKIVGHGLDQDLKMLNLTVPSQNVIDTVELYRLPGKRYISLQFLAFHLLDKKIQEDEHDSIQDASAALELYMKYLTFVERGDFEDVLDRLYEIGYKTNWAI